MICVIILLTLFLGSIITLLSFVFIYANFSNLTLWATTIGIGFAFIPVYVFTQLPVIVKPHQVGMGLGLLTVASNLGTTLGSTAFGTILDKTKGEFSVAIMALAMVSLAIIVISLLLKSKVME